MADENATRTGPHGPRTIPATPLFAVNCSAAAAITARRLKMPILMPESPSDEQLVADARNGDRSAFESLVRRYQRPLYFLCQRYVREHDAAADLTQRSFLKAFERLSELRDTPAFKGWLFKIAIRLALNHIRDHARFVDEEPASPQPAGQDDALTLLEAGEQTQALRQAVARLPTKQRMTLELRTYEELSFKEIAEALGTTEGTAKVNFHYAVRSLRAILRRDPRAAKEGLG